jgi:integrase
LALVPSLRAEAQRCDGVAASRRGQLVIALWLGHESIETTQTYLHAHLALKDAALEKLKPYEHGRRTRFRPKDRLLAFLEAL